MMYQLGSAVKLLWGELRIPLMGRRSRRDDNGNAWLLSTIATITPMRPSCCKTEHWYVLKQQHIFEIPSVKLIITVSPVVWAFLRAEFMWTDLGHASSYPTRPNRSVPLFFISGCCHSIHHYIKTAMIDWSQ